MNSTLYYRVDSIIRSWEHIAHASRKGLAASEALARIATSTWGPSARQSRLLYTAIVRPTLLYGAQEWNIRPNGKALAAKIAAPLHKVQNDCLRKVTGAYKRTPRAALERETQTPPIDLYMEIIKGQRAIRARNHPVEAKIAQTANKIWVRMRRARGTQPRPQTGREIATAQAVNRVNSTMEWIQVLRDRRGPRQRRRRTDSEPQQTSEASLINKWGMLSWQQRWTNQAQRVRGGHKATAWRTPWAQDTRKLYAGLTKAEATALFLMRTEVIGLNAWLAAIQVPRIAPVCSCGTHAQTVRHILLHCPRVERTDLIVRCGTERMEEILGRPECARHAARWLVRSGIMEQFRAAAEIEQEDRSGYRPFDSAEQW